MDNNFINIKERILLIANNHGISYETFSKSIGMTYGNFKGINKKRPINSDTIAKVLTNYPSVNSEWLLLGKGEMLKKEIPNSGVNQIIGNNNNQNINQFIHSKEILHHENEALKREIKLLKEMIEIYKNKLK